MNRASFERYAEIKNSIKSLEEEAKELAPEILEMVDSTVEKKIASDFGTFSITTRRNWKFTHAVVTIEDEVKRMKEEEIATGKATANEMKSIRYDALKEDEES